MFGRAHSSRWISIRYDNGRTIDGRHGEIAVGVCDDAVRSGPEKRWILHFNNSLTWGSLGVKIKQNTSSLTIL
jgi:hypothetical protein